MNSIPLYRMEQRFARKKGRRDLSEIHRAGRRRTKIALMPGQEFFYGGLSRMVEEGLAIIKKQKVHKAKIQTSLL